jgi:hypothetical protein|tara:strand:- start:32 stop:697 length:666 start_codon:yes stop_codon:yes gene_type:complete
MTKFTFFLKMIYYSIKLFFYKKKLLFIVSFPRSAQGPVSSVLQKYAEKFNIELKYCEFYQCCNTIPCAKGSNIIKNHDYNQILPFSKNHKYLVLLRKDKLDQLDSYYRLKNPKVETFYQDSIIDFNRFKSFYLKNETYYDSFKRRWLNLSNLPNVKILYYEDFVNDYVNSIVNIIKFFKLSSNPDRVIIKSLIKNKKRHLVEIKKKNLNFLRSNFNINEKN